MNKKGETVKDESEAFGLKCTHKLIHPEYVLFADEVGSNTNQKEDGNYGGDKRLAKRGSTPKQMCSSSDAHWTLLGFTDANGQPVMCGIIFKADTLTAEERLGLDIFADVIEPQDDIVANYGPGKRFPGPPRCYVRGIEAPSYVACSEKGSITLTILRGMLERLDSLRVFPRGVGKPLPFLLVDGHGSRLKLPFIEYINHLAHKWKVCLGLPYGTSFWQVGDSSERIGSYYMETYRYKDMLIKKRMEMNVKSLNIKRSDIIPIVNSARSKSFANVDNNVKAIRDRGWGPLTRNLLQHPEILASKKESEEQVAIRTVSTLSTPSFDYVTNDVDNTPNNVTPNEIVILAKNKKDSNTKDSDDNPVNNVTTNEVEVDQTEENLGVLV